MPKKVFDSISITLLNSGVTRAALRSTLPKEGKGKLREMIRAGQFNDGEGVELNYVFFPGYDPELKDYEHSALVFSLFHKEILLSGRKAVAVPIFRLVEEKDDYITSMGEMDFLFFPDFYLTSDNENWISYERSVTRRIEYRLRTLYEKHGVHLCFYTATGLYDASHWWSHAFINFLARTSIEIDCKSGEE
jgi:hypothetical protein